MLKTNFYSVHPENVLLAMVFDQNEEIRFKIIFFLFKYDRFHAHCHTQGVERAVKDVSFACRSSATSDDRVGLVRQAK